ncbi:hypothetical protein [Occultella kanbiaonis]|uniref:NucA/NucB deoxyribonuclease domain-containing protein n=1 Tax=Occultella kanbiaonis TaxID=2675754 RepID=UPI0013CF6D34|nr:hypothetical protein [Occultella kanbiaonis]
MWVEPELDQSFDRPVQVNEFGTEQCSDEDAGETQVCVTVDEVQDVQVAPVPPTPGESVEGDGLGVITPQAIVPVPAWCLDAGVTNAWSVTRTQGCGIFSGVLTVTQTVNGVVTVVGTMNFLMYEYVYVLTDNLTWASQIEVSPTIITGAAAGTIISGTSTCTGVCTGSSTFPPQTPGVGGDASGESYYTTTPAVGAAALAYPGWALSFKAPTAAAPASLATGGNLAVRCDNALPGRGPGCVLPYVTGRLTYSSHPDYYPEFGAHVLAAQASGLPGNAVPLHRTTNSALRDANRAAACKSPSVIPRPTGNDCDEYPFASTYEGAAAGGPGRTFSFCSVTYYPTGVTSPTGFSICMINSAENQLAGSQMNSVLFVPYRIIDGDPFFISIT